eukprot:5012367-Alexandrium_andersonii.AAC.1
MGSQAAGRIHLCSAVPFVGPGGPVPEAPGADQPDDGQLEEDLGATIEVMNGGTRGLASARSGLIELARNSSR